jgi:hypothetical protein
MIRKSSWFAVMLLILTGVVFSYGKVLLVIEKSYVEQDSVFKISSGFSRIERYINEIDTIDGISCDTIQVDQTIHGNNYGGYNWLWDRLADEYRYSVVIDSLKDTIRGAVLIGDVPVPMYYVSEEGPKPCDYVYMDLWDSANGGMSYDTLADLWDYFSPNFTKYLQADGDTAKGDGVLEIWVSRIYTSSIEHLREDTTSDWDEYLIPHQIINNYLDRVHARMTTRSTVPQRAFVIGANNFTNDTSRYDNPGEGLNEYLRFNTMKWSSLNYFINKESNPFNWQAQLQAGPYGNINSGSFKTNSFLDTTAVDCRRAEYYGDTRGYEWAGIFEHSSQYGHSFGGQLDGGNWDNISKYGGFASLQNVPLWKKVPTGGYEGNGYFLAQNRNKIKHYDGVHEYAYLNNIAYWCDTITPAKYIKDNYRIYMYYQPSPGKNIRCYVNYYTVV